MSIVAVDRATQASAAKEQVFLSDLMNNHRPVYGSFGYMMCAEQCRSKDGGIQHWPCSTFTSAQNRVAEVHAHLAHEARKIQNQRASEN